MISGLVACVGYAPRLELGLERWRDGLEQLLVVTSLDDVDTLALCMRLGVQVLSTDAFHRDPAAYFNKAAALEEGFAYLDPQDWCLFLDADVVPPPDWRQRLDGMKVTPGHIYGARRKLEPGQVDKGHGEQAGYFQLWHCRDPVAQSRPLLGSWVSCASYDTMFLRRWAMPNRVFLPLELTHVGEVGANWCGLGNAEGLAALHAERDRHAKDWMHERLA